MHTIGCIVLEKLLNLDGGGNDSESQHCSVGHKASFIETREKEVLTVVGKIRLKRNYYYDSVCRKGWCPKDKALSIESSSFSPGVRRIMGRVGSSRPFAVGGSGGNIGNWRIRGKFQVN